MRTLVAMHDVKEGEVYYYSNNMNERSSTLEYEQAESHTYTQQFRKIHVVTRCWSGECDAQM